MSQTDQQESVQEEHEGKPTGKYLAALSLAAMGVVYGDIGTSPLYAMRESFHEDYGLVANHFNVLGVLSLIVWALIIVIAIKYLTFVLRADKDGEGGILVLAALITPRGKRSRYRHILILLGLFGAALLYGDSTITPAISVLSAVEGLKVATPVFQPYIIPITIGILIALFSVQYLGTASIGKTFGSIMLLWFSTLAVMGVSQIMQDPRVLAAINPIHAFRFFAKNGLTGLLVMGSVFLVVTGGEALYADIGHFGTRPIRLTWFFFVMPCLLLNYFGQGALILRQQAASQNPFFLMTPDWAIYPVVILATAATIIASQAVISGAYSLTRQAVQFGYFPRVKIKQTSSKESGQIYIPSVNWALMVICIALVLGFKSSSNLAAAYGVAVTTTMVITTIIFAVVAYKNWGWSLPAVLGLCGAFMVVDLAFFGANLPKIPDGGWFPLIITTAIFVMMTTWNRGRDILAKRIQKGALPLDKFLSDVEDHVGVEGAEIVRVNGTAVYMYSNPDDTPPALLHNLKHNKVLHETVVILSITTAEVPHVPDNKRVDVEEMGGGVYRVEIHYGFAEDVNVSRALDLIEEPGLDLNLHNTTFFLGRERVLATNSDEMARWRDRLYGVMARNATNATSYFNIPPERVVEVGAQVEL